MEEQEDFSTLFQEEAREEPERKSHKCVVETLQGEKYFLELVFQHPLWGHMLWNAGKWLANYLEANNQLYQHKRYSRNNPRVVEFGAGAGLPSLVCCRNGASFVLSTDYPDANLITNLEGNFKRNIPATKENHYQIKGFLWGSNIESELDPQPFDLVILSDLLFNHSEHKKLAASLQASLAQNGLAICSFTHHRPWLAHKDLNFFEIAKEFGLDSEKIHSEIMSPAFELDRGDEIVRSTIHVYFIRHKTSD